MKVIFAQLYSDLQPPNAEPLSIEALASALLTHRSDIRVELQEVNPVIDSCAVGNLLNIVSTSNCQLLGLSIPQGTFATACEILNTIEETFELSNRPIVVLGHALPSHFPNVFLDKYPWVYVVRGWGEAAITALVELIQQKGSSLGTVPNLVYKQDGVVKINPLDYSVVPQVPVRLDTSRYFARVETSRGCHYGYCTFCTRPPGKKNYWSRIAFHTIEETIRDLKDKGSTYFTFTDEDFIGNDLLGASAIAQLLQKVGGMSFSMSVRADNIRNPKGSPEENNLRLQLLHDLKHAGLSLVYIGVESLSNSQLIRYGKGISVEDSVKAVQIVKGLEIPLEVGFITFDPFVTIDELFEIVHNLRVSRLWENVGSIFSKMLVQKDTAYENWLRKSGLLGEPHIDTMSYEWNFSDASCAKVAHCCFNWFAEFHPVYRLLRNLERTKQDHLFAHIYMTQLKLLDLEVFEDVLSRAKKSSSKTLTVPAKFYNKRYRIAESLCNKIGPRTDHDEESILLERVKQYTLGKILREAS